jgi:hypothetical protein
MHVISDDLIPPHKYYNTDITEEQMCGTELYAPNISDDICTNTGNHSNSA